MEILTSKLLTPNEDMEMRLNDSMIIIGHAALDKNYCNAIIDMFNKAAFTELKSMDEEHGGHVVPLNDYESDRVKYTDIEGVEHYTIIGNNPDLPKIMDYITDLVPWGDDFQQVSYMQIMRYPTEGFMAFHKDEADSNDTGTVIFNLNDNFTGGNLTVDGHIIRPFEGSMIAFNNSTHRWHGVEPVLTGERYVLSIWFAPINEEENQQESMTEYDTSDSHPTNKITIKGI